MTTTDTFLMTEQAHTLMHAAQRRLILEHSFTFEVYLYRELQVDQLVCEQLVTDAEPDNGHYIESLLKAITLAQRALRIAGVITVGAVVVEPHDPDAPERTALVMTVDSPYKRFTLYRYFTAGEYDIVFDGPTLDSTGEESNMWEELPSMHVFDSVRKQQVAVQ